MIHEKYLSNRPVFGPGIEAGASFGAEVPMAVDFSLGILGLKVLQQLQQRSLLGFSPSVLRCLAVRGNTTDITDTDRVGVTSLTMGTYLLFLTALMYGAVTIDNIMIAYLPESPCLMPLVNVGNGEILAFRSGTAMYDNFLYDSHRLPIVKVTFFIFHPQLTLQRASADAAYLT